MSLIPYDHSFFLHDMATVPSLSPYRNFLLTAERDLMRPVPVVLRLVAFTLHPYFRVLAPGYPQEAHSFF